MKIKVNDRVKNVGYFRNHFPFEGVVEEIDGNSARVKLSEPITHVVLHIDDLEIVEDNGKKIET